MSEKCLFCRIIQGDIPSHIVAQDDQVVVFKDIHPKARIHYLIVPREHVATVNDLDLVAGGTHVTLVSSMMRMAQDIARREGFADFGYKLSVHCNHGGGQEVFHLHLHLLSDFGV